jgi:Tfp pilus assembly protein PilW
MRNAATTTSNPTTGTGGSAGSRRPRGRRWLGLSLVEMMVALAITATLLTAAAVAFNASSAVVEANDEFFRATQAGRISLHQMLTQVRRAKSVHTNSNTHNLILTTAPDGSGGGEDGLCYQYVPTTHKLMLVTLDDVTDPDYVLASNVSDVTIGIETETLPAPYVARVNISMTVTVGKNVVTLSGSAAPRRALTY